MARRTAWQRLVGAKIRAAKRRGMSPKRAFRSGVAAAKRVYRRRHPVRRTYRRVRHRRLHRPRSRR